MKDKTPIDTIAGEIRDAYQTCKPIAPIKSRFADGDVNAAYAVQSANTRFWIGQGRRVVGRKIGLTSLAVQKQLGVDQPDFGVLFADMAVGNAETAKFTRVLQPKIETEVALILGKDIDCPRPILSDVVRAIEYVTPALEIVGSRIANWEISIVDTVADNASSGLFVLGDPMRRLSGLNLASCRMRMTRGGEEVSAGVGKACLGHPLNAAAWLAQTLVDRGDPLRAGDVVLTGALGPMVAVRPGDVFEATIEGLGDVTVGFSTE